MRTRETRRRSLVVMSVSALALGLSAAPAFAHVQLNDPNGGEQLQAGSVFTIEWQILIQHNLINWDLSYSTTSQSGPWTVIATDLAPGSQLVGSIHTYDWTIPDVNAPSAWVRVIMDNSATDYFDVSASPFTIIPTNPPPANDMCLGAPFVPPGTVAFTNVFATDSAGEEKNCAGFGSDVWFKTVLCDGVTTIGVCDADFDTMLAIPAAQAARRLVDQCAPFAERLDCAEALKYVDDIIVNGNGASRQRRVRQDAGDLQEVVRYLVAQARHTTAAAVTAG